MACGDPPMWWQQWPQYGCTCPSAWCGIVPPPCPVHNPQPCVTVRTTTTLGEPMLRYSTIGAWECPRCQRINAPMATHCDCKPEVGP